MTSAPDLLAHFGSLLWPAAVIVVALAVVLVVWILRSPLTNLMNRLQSVNAKGVQVTTVPGQTLQAEAKLDTGLSLPETISPSEEQRSLSQPDAPPLIFNRVDSSPEVVRRESDLRQYFAEQKNGSALDTEILINALATMQWNLLAARLYRVLFVSQIKFLKVLNVFSLGREEATFYFELYDPDHVEDYTCERWLAFPIGQGLISLHDDTYSITSTGREFLVWMAREGVPEYK